MAQSGVFWTLGSSRIPEWGWGRKELKLGEFHEASFHGVWYAGIWYVARKDNLEQDVQICVGGVWCDDAS